MFKKYLGFAAIVAALVSCNKEVSVNQGESSGEQEKTIVVKATLGTDTRVDYAPTDEGGYKASFTDKDYLQIWFHKPDNGSAGQINVAPIDPSSISEDGRSASFIVNYAEVPSTVDYVFAGLCYSGCEYSANGVSLASQTGLEINALNHCLIAGKCMISDIKVSGDKMSVPLKLEHRTSIFKLVLTLPEGADAQTADAKKPSTVSITNANNAFHNSIALAWGSFNGKETKGGISAKFAKVDGNVATSYVTVWAEDDFKDSKITVTTGNGVYTTDFTPAASISAGKIYTVARTLALPAENKVVWKNDDAGTIDFPSSGGEEVSEGGWLSCKDNKVTWTANNTGAPRTAKLSFKNGSSFELSQLSPADFKGNYSLWSKRFGTDTAPNASSDNSAAVETSGIVFGDPLKGETLTDVDGKTYTNQIGVKGLYYDGVMDATVVIDYEAMTVRVGMFLDARSTAGQLHNSGKLAEYPYVCFLPGMGTTTSTSLWAATWNFVQPNLSTTDATDYTWLWFNVSSDFTTLNYSPNSSAGLQYLNTDAKTSANAICAITVAVSKSADISPANVRTSWDAVYQGNKFSNNDGITFIKK